MTNQDITGQSTGDVENLGYSVISAPSSRDADAVAQSGPVRVVKPGYSVETMPDIGTEAIQREFQRRAAEARPQLAEMAAVEQQSSNRPQISSINATNNSMANAPAPQLDVETQQQVLARTNDRARQNVIAGLSAGGVRANAAMEFIKRQAMNLGLI